MELEQSIFDLFVKNVNNKVTPYLQKFNFKINDIIKNESMGQSISFNRENETLSISYSTHHLDYQDGIMITFNSKFGKIFLHNEVTKKSNEKFEPYHFSPRVIDESFDRILSDMKAYIEKYFE